MIPRTKVNYGIEDLCAALVCRAADTQARAALCELIRSTFGIEHVILTPSGRGALYYLLKAADQRRVVVPAYTCNAVIEAAMLAEKEIVRVEVSWHDFNMRLDALKSAVDQDSIVIATHQFGIPCAIREIADICKRCGALLLEDVAPALGTRIDGRLAGTFSDAAFFSFDSTKLVNVPLKGGFLIVRDDEYYKRVMDAYRAGVRAMPFAHKLRLLFLGFALVLLKNHVLYRIFHWYAFKRHRRVSAETSELSLKLDPYYLYDFAEWQAQIALKQMRNLDALIERRRRAYASYSERLSGCRAIDLPPPDLDGQWACIRFPIRVRGDKIRYYWSGAERGLDCAFSFTFLACPPEFSQAWKIANSVLDIPFYGELSDAELDAVVGIIRFLDSGVTHEG
jgi:dTDP-4-amino-4,6-dideoxygalactose transaminase